MFFVFQFHSSMLDLLKIKLHNLFWFGFHEVIIVSWINMRIDRLTRIDSNKSNMFRLNIYKKISSLIFISSQTMLLLFIQGDSGPIKLSGLHRSVSIWFKNIFHFKKHYQCWIYFILKLFWPELPCNAN